MHFKIDSVVGSRLGVMQENASRQSGANLLWQVFLFVIFVICQGGCLISVFFLECLPFYVIHRFHIEPPSLFYWVISYSCAATVAATAVFSAFAFSRYLIHKQFSVDMMTLFFGSLIAIAFYARFIPGGLQ